MRQALAMSAAYASTIMKTFLTFLLFVSLSTGGAMAADESLIVPASGGSVFIPSTADKASYDQYHYAPARRAGDTLYISGVVVGRRPDEGTDVAAFKVQVRRAFERIRRTLAAAGCTFADVAMINSFHVWQGPNFEGNRGAQFAAFGEVKDEFMKEPHPAWTAVGTTSLLPDAGIVEIQMIAHIPPAKR
jgi:enamine deaminase RidA (YjgF/YER057c/UK114 family)